MSDTEKKIRPWAFMPPEMICLPVSRFMMRGAMNPGIDFTMEADPRIIMHSVYYTTNKRIHGLRHYESTNQLFFLGYECQECGEVFLVPESVKDQGTLGEAMQHGCTVTAP